MSSQSDYKTLDSQYYMPAFGREIMITRGSGSTVYDADNNAYLDLVAGIAVCSTGHCHPKVVQAIQKQAAELIHCSNLFYVPHQAELARELVRITGLSKAFFSNSGAEANEAALKLARIRTGKKNFIACEGAFHGRTMGSLACTYKPAIREPFEPLQPECTFVPYGVASAIEKAVDDNTAGVIIEPIQGESGVIIPKAGYLREVRKICDEKGLILIFDEIQTGMGRTGTWMSYQHEGVKPDIVTLAKGIASGFPMGAIVAREGLEFGRSEHGSTFAGGPLACAAALATIEVLEDLLPSIKAKGERFASALQAHHPRVSGLMIGFYAGERCAEIQKKCVANGVLINCAANGNIRLVPPLVITESEIDRACEVINAALG